LLHGLELDLRPRVNDDWESLAHYCYLVASTVGERHLAEIEDRLSALGVPDDQRAISRDRCRHGP
jgi:phytoene/squalene synthetase